MMKPDLDIDTEKYSGHNIHNNMFIKTFPDPGNMKISLKMALPGAIVQAIDFPGMNIDFTTYVPDDIKKNSVSPVAPVAKINFMAASHDAAPSPRDERKPTQTVCAAYRSPMPWGFMAGRNAIRRRNGVMGHCVLKKKFHIILFHPPTVHFHP